MVQKIKKNEYKIFMERECQVEKLKIIEKSEINVLNA